MWVLIDRLGLILFDATLSTAALLSLTTLAILVCRQPARRLFIARVALCASLLMFPLVALAPLPRVDLFQTLTRSKLVPAGLGQRLLPAQERLPLENAVPYWTHSSSITHDLQSRGIGHWLVRGLTLFDLAGIGTGLAWLVLGVWGVHWLLRQSHEPNAETRALYHRLRAGGSPILTRTRLRVSARLRRPAVVGLFQPTILLPASFDADLDPDQLRLSLLHEMAHVEQRDHWQGALANLAHSAWFFLPHVWWLRSQVRIDQEFLADRFAASRFGSSSGYAASLLMLAARARRPGSRPSSGRCEPARALEAKPKTDRRSPLFQRLLMLLYCPHRIETRAPRLWSWGLRVAVIGLALSAACVSIRWPEAEANGLPPSGRALPKRQPFRVADFVATPTLFPQTDRAFPYVLPVILPDRFDLKVEVLATRAQLASSRIAGHLLGFPRWANGATSAPDSEQSGRESWHQVRLVRDGQDLQLSVDSSILPVTMEPERTTESLTIEPDPGRAVRFRNLIVEW